MIFVEKPLAETVPRPAQVVDSATRLGRNLGWATSSPPFRLECG